MAQKLLYLIVVLLICSELALGFKKGEKGLSKKKLEEKNKGIKRTEELKVDVVVRSSHLISFATQLLSVITHHWIVQTRKVSKTKQTGRYTHSALHGN
jgi:hypothetical protein